MIAAARNSLQPLVEVKELSVSFRQANHAKFEALNRVSLVVHQGETISLVGESGAGKSLLTRAILGLLDESAVVEGGTLRWEDEDLLSYSPEQWRRWRKDNIAVIWQNPQASLVPVYPVGRQFHWLLRLHGICSTAERTERMLELFGKVGLRDPHRVARQFPSELSGGECQRVMIAMAIAQPKKLLLADEPTSNLDVILQAEIVGLLETIAREHNLALLFITHDLSLASRITNRAVVLFQGRVVEEGQTQEIFRSPRHSYTQMLVASSCLRQ